MLRFLTTSLFTALAGIACAQPGSSPEMADLFRASGKIYVVVGVVSVIFTGIIFFLIRLDRKLTRLEREAKK